METDTTTVETPPVLSQTPGEELPATIAPQAPTPAETPPKAHVDERRRNAENAQRRIANKQYRQRLAELNNADTRKEVTEAILANASAQGFDTNDEATRKQADLIAGATVTADQIRKRREQSIKAEAATSILGDTLDELGYQKGSEGWHLMGQLLFKRVGVENPDAYSDRDFVEREIEKIHAATNRKKPSDPVGSAVAAKAGAPKPAGESRVKASVTPPDDGVKALREQHPDMSEETAKQLIEKRTKLPKWAQ